MDTSKKSNCDPFTFLIHELIDTFTKWFFGFDQFYEIIQLLNQLQSWRNHYGYNDSSIPDLLNRIGKYLEESHLSQLSHYFYLEQLRIEELYLGPFHPDLAQTLNSIGQVYSTNDQFLEATDYFSSALNLLKRSKRKGKLYALILYNTGLVQHHTSLFTDAKETFQLALEEQQTALGEFHPDVAEMHFKIGKLQFESGNIGNAMDNFLKALMIIRMTMGNDSSKVSEILYYIGLSHDVNGEHTDALNSFRQSLIVAKRNFQDITCKVMILHKMCLTYEHLGDTNNAIHVLLDIVNMVIDKVGEKHICVAVVLGSLRNLYAEQGMVEKSIKVANDIKKICQYASEESDYDTSSEFIEFIADTFGYVIEDNLSMAAAAA